jgi:hypothetical protein
VRRSARRRRPPRERAEFPAGGFHSLSSLCPAVHWAVAAARCPRFRPNLAGGRSHDSARLIRIIAARSEHRGPNQPTKTAADCGWTEPTAGRACAAELGLQKNGFL